MVAAYYFALATFTWSVILHALASNLRGLKSMFVLLFTHLNTLIQIRLENYIEAMMGSK